jgi:hypothetical protein
MSEQSKDVIIAALKNRNKEIEEENKKLISNFARFYENISKKCRA